MTATAVKGTTEPAGGKIMAGKVRLVVVVDEELRDALRLKAAKRRKDMADIVSDLLRDELSAELEELRRLAEQDKGRKGGK
jgi:hypothetical protein